MQTDASHAAYTITCWPGGGTQYGCWASKGEFLAFTGHDCMPAPDWLQTLATHFTKTPDRMIGGRTLNILPDNLYSTTSQLIVDIVYRHYNANRDSVSQHRQDGSKQFSIL